MPPITQAINKATGYTPDLGFRGNTTGSPYNADVYQSNVPRAFPNNSVAPPTSAANPYAAEIAALAAENDRIRQQTAALPKLLPYDYVAKQNQARSQAEAAINPRYTQLFNDFIGQAQVQQQRKTEDVNQANTLLDENLKHVQEANATQIGRVGQDTQTNLDTIANQQQNYQQDSGQAYDASRAAQAIGLSASGLSGSGLGAQQADAAQTSRNTQESRQVQSFDVQKKAQELFKSRSFEDIAKSNELGTKATGKGKQANALDLARYIEDYGTQKDSSGHYTAYNTKNSVDSLEQQRLAAVQSNQQQQYQNIFNQFVGSLKGARGQDISLLKSVYGA